MARMNMSAPKEPPLFRINDFKGINLSTTPSQIDNNESPDMLNFHIDERGALTKRTGYERVFEIGLGAGKVHGMVEYLKEDGTIEFVFAHGRGLYRLTDDGPESIYMHLSGEHVSFFQVGYKLFIQDGIELLYYEGTIVADVTSNAYIPTLTISRTPSGGGEPYEDFNLVGKEFQDSFSGDGTSTVYQLSLTDLDSNYPIQVWVDEDFYMEGDGNFTFDKQKGTVTFSTAPPKGTNNVIILAAKTIEEFKDRIFKCTLNVLFGGGNDTRVFIGGNPDYPNQVWRSGLYEPTYWPENGFYKVGQDGEKVQGFIKQYDYLVVEKERSKWNIGFELSADGTPSFPIKPINDQVGTIARHSIQLIDNTPVSLSRKGIYQLTASNIRDERNVKHLSDKVDSRLLREPNLQNAVSVDFDKKYWLAVNGNVYVYDYSLEEWYIYDNIFVDCFFVYENNLYFGYQGMIYRFKDKNHPNPYNDDGDPINAYWYSKLLNFDAPERYKMIKRIFHTIFPDTHSSSSVYIRTDKRGETLIEHVRADQLNFDFFDFTRFSFVTSEFPQQGSQKVKEKKITHIQLKIENKELDEGLKVVDLGIKYTFQTEVK